jgi:hypothetical protein
MQFFVQLLMIMTRYFIKRTVYVRNEKLLTNYSTTDSQIQNATFYTTILKCTSSVSHSLACNVMPQVYSINLHCYFQRA